MCCFCSGRKQRRRSQDRGAMKDIGDRIIQSGERILVTGAAGFVGLRVVKCLVEYGYRNICCLVRPTSKTERLESIARLAVDGCRLEIVKGNLLSRDDCARVSREATVIFHLAAGRGQKWYRDAFMNSVARPMN